MVKRDADESSQDDAAPTSDLVVSSRAAVGSAQSSGSRDRCLRDLTLVANGDLLALNNFVTSLLEYFHEDLPNTTDMFVIGRCLSAKAIDVLQAVKIECDNAQNAEHTTTVPLRLLSFAFGVALTSRHCRMLSAAHAFKLSADVVFANRDVALTKNHFALVAVAYCAYFSTLSNWCQCLLAWCLWHML